MKKNLIGILIGLVLGAGAAWTIMRRDGPAGPSKAESTAPKPEEKPNPLFFPEAKHTAAGISLHKPSETAVAPEVQAFGRVLDPGPLVTLVAELQTARAACTASEKELERARKLFAAGGNASAQAVETAEANATRDRAGVSSTQARLLASWGRAITENLDTVSQALSENAVLVRLDVLPGENMAASPKTARLSIAGSNEIFDAEIPGVAPTTDLQVQGTPYLALVRGHPLPAGMALRGLLPGTGDSTKALVVPRSAIVYHQGSAWLYVLGEGNTFQRKLVTLGRSVDNNSVVITEGLAPDDQIATVGALQLLATELQAGGAAAED